MLQEQQLGICRDVIALGCLPAHPGQVEPGLFGADWGAVITNQQHYNNLAHLGEVLGKPKTLLKHAPMETPFLPVLCLSSDTRAFPRVPGDIPAPVPAPGTRWLCSHQGTCNLTPKMLWRRSRGAQALIACPVGLGWGLPSPWRWRLSYHPVSTKRMQVKSVSLFKSPGALQAPDNFSQQEMLLTTF